MDDWDGQEDVIQAMLLSEQPVEPFPDITDLFQIYNSLYFENKLGFCSVEWSSARMTLCAGICTFRKHGGCCIRLSEPLLKYRPVTDLKQGGIRDRGDHGPKFCSKMQEINVSKAPDPYRPTQGYKITTHHDFTDEVDLYRTHWWQCDKCGTIVKRAMNRPPQPADCRGRMGRGDACADPYCTYHDHLRNCGGAYKKIREPEPKAKPAPKKRGRSVDSVVAPSGSMPTGSHSITEYFKTGDGKAGDGNRASTSQGIAQHTSSHAQHVDPDLIGSDEDEGTSAEGQQGQGARQQRQTVAPACDPSEKTAEQRRSRCLQAALTRFDTKQQGQQQAEQQHSEVQLQKARQKEDVPKLQEGVQGQGQHQMAADQPLREQLAQGPVRTAGSREIQQPVKARSGSQIKTGPTSSNPIARLQDVAARSKKAVVVLELDSDDSIDADKGLVTAVVAPAAAPSNQVKAARVQHDLASLPDFVCPVCMHAWPAGSISNDELNRHLDACLQ